MRQTLQQWLEYGSSLLEHEKMEEAAIDAKYLLLEAFQLDTAHFLMDRNCILKEESKEAVRKYQAMLEKRAQRVPLQYITGNQEFMGLKFHVNPQVLIPRQDTETLVEWVLEECQDPSVQILDLCTGSGCIAVSLKRLGKYHHVTGVDISPEALETARFNGNANECDITWILSDLFQDVFLKPRFYDVIASNPPYIPTKVIEGLEPEVKDHEPMLALDGTEDGLYFYRKLARECPAYLKPHGRVYFEIGHDQAVAVKELLEVEGFKEIEIRKDQPGLDRVIRAVYPGTEKAL